jgi:hypothetical protein
VFMILAVTSAGNANVTMVRVPLRRRIPGPGAATNSARVAPLSDSR